MPASRGLSSPSARQTGDGQFDAVLVFRLRSYSYTVPYRIVSYHTSSHPRRAQIYWVGPMAGGAVATLLYRWVLGRKWERCAAAKRAADWELADVGAPTVTSAAPVPPADAFGANADKAAEPAASNGASPRDPQLVSLIP